MNIYVCLLYFVYAFNQDRDGRAQKGCGGIDRNDCHDTLPSSQLSCFVPFVQ